jgi:hypothetical protein
MNNNYLDIWTLNTAWCILATITPNDKLTIQGNNIQVVKNYPGLGVIRFLRGDCRDDIYSLIDTLIDYTRYHFNNSGTTIIEMNTFHNNILAGMIGLLHLRETYNKSTGFLAILNAKLQKFALLRTYYENTRYYDEYLRIYEIIFKTI